jgi:hypothetical protein
MKQMSKPLSMVFTLALALSIAPSAKADLDECSVSTLKGSFGIETSGSIVAFGPVGLVAEAGIIKFDGAGVFRRRRLSA